MKGSALEACLKYPLLKDAYEVAKKFVVSTPITQSKYLSELSDANVYLKLETYQETGAFKFRGALNSLIHLSKNQEISQVVCASSGSHAMGMSLAGNLLGIEVTVFLPKITPSFKSKKISSFGGKIIFEGDYVDESQAAAQNYAEEKQIPYISPYNHTHTIQGNGGFIAHELLNSNIAFQNIFVPIGGGGLIAGLSAALKLNGKDCSVYGVESSSNPSMYRAIKMSDPYLKNDFKPSLAEALICGVSELGYPAIKKYVDEFLLVEEDEIKRIMEVLYKQEGLKLEGAGAITSAALLRHIEKFKGQDSIVVVTGGNIEDSFFES